MPGTVLLLAAAPAGKGCLVDAASVLPVLAAVPPTVLSGTDTANVVELADPLEPQAVLTRLRAAAAAPAPLTVFVAGQLHLDRRQHLPHLALARTTASTVRYTGFPWHWFREELRLRAPGSTTLLLDLHADPETWEWLRTNPLDSGRNNAVYGRIAPPPSRRTVAGPAYMKAVATLLRSGHRPPLEQLHQQALSRISPDAGVGTDIILTAQAPAQMPPQTPAAQPPHQSPLQLRPHNAVQVPGPATAPVGGPTGGLLGGPAGEPAGAPVTGPLGGPVAVPVGSSVASSVGGQPPAQASPQLPPEVPGPMAAPGASRLSPELPPEAPAPLPAQVPEPIRAQKPEPVRAHDPAPIRAQAPAPIPAQVPEPIRAQTPEPSRAHVPTSVRAQAPAPIPVRDPESIPVQDPTLVLTKLSPQSATPAATQETTPSPALSPEPGPAPSPASSSAPSPEPSSAPSPEPSSVSSPESSSVPNRASSLVPNPVLSTEPGPAPSPASNPAPSSPPSPELSPAPRPAPSPAQVLPPMPAHRPSSSPAQGSVPAPAQSAATASDRLPVLSPVPADPHAHIAAAVESGRHSEAEVLAAHHEQAALRTHGPASEEALHWIEVRADLAMLAGDPVRSCRTWLTVASARLSAGQAVDAAAVEAAVDRAHHQWGQIRDTAPARELGAVLAELRGRVPGRRRGALENVLRQLRQLQTQS